MLLDHGCMLEKEATSLTYPKDLGGNAWRSPGPSTHRVPPLT